MEDYLYMHLEDMGYKFQMFVGKGEIIGYTRSS